MKLSVLFMLVLSLFVVCESSYGVNLVFEDIRPPDSSQTANFTNSSIAWRPQGDYAILVSTRTTYPSSVGIHRYDLVAETLTYQAYTYPDQNFQRAEFSADGTWALITGGQKIFRYEHNPSGFGLVTELTDIQDGATCTISFYDVLRHPVDDNEPMYITANVNCGSTHQMKVYRYDPLASPQVYADVTGGVTPTVTGATGYQPVTAAWQADGLYMVVGNYQPSSAHGGFFVWDPHHSLFPPHHQTNVMQFFSGGGLTNISTLCMSPVSTDPRFVMVKGTGRVVRFTEYPTTMVADWPSGWHTSIPNGDSGFNPSGTLCIFLERQEWTNYHRIMLFDSIGDTIDIEYPVVGPNFTNQTGVRILSMKWHPFLNVGLMAGGNRWIFKFEYAPPPAPDSPSNCAAAPDSICDGDTSQIFLTASFTSGDSLYWFVDQSSQPVGPPSGSGYVASGSPALVSAPVSDTTWYAWTYSDSTMQWSNSSCSTTVFVHPLPPAVADSNSPVDAGQTLELYGEPAGNYSYLWTRSTDAWTSTDKDPVILNAQPDDSAFYTLRVTNNITGCFDEDTVEAIVGDMPPPPPIPAAGPVGLGLLLVLLTALIHVSRCKKST